MAITQAMCNSFKTELLGGTHDLDTDVIKIALFTSSATLDASTTAYSTTNEVVGSGYTAGGNTLAGATISLSGSTAIVDFTDTTWSSATITARGALIYNSRRLIEPLLCWTSALTRAAPAVTSLLCSPLLMLPTPSSVLLKVI